MAFGVDIPLEEKIPLLHNVVCVWVCKYRVLVLIQQPDVDCKSYHHVHCTRKLQNVDLLQGKYAHWHVLSGEAWPTSF